MQQKSLMRQLRPDAAKYINEWMNKCFNRYCCCSVAKSCWILCNLTDCSTPSFPVLHHLPEFAHTRVHWVHDAIQPSHPLSSPSTPALTVPTSGSFPISQLFPSGGQSIRTSASASSLPVNIQGWYPLRLTNFISLLSKGLSKSSQALWFKSINSSVLSLLCSPTLTSVHDYWKNDNFDYTDICL